ncbi:cellulase family glycosylhydrolase [Populibacterium corticicola]|uniref:Endoglucanase n=1 Tax=Populibacterium corticicola TaxID=1812826 RepID=A0ABW5XEE6_9MICO
MHTTQKSSPFMRAVAVISTLALGGIALLSTVAEATAPSHGVPAFEGTTTTSTDSAARGAAQLTTQPTTRTTGTANASDSSAGNLVGTDWLRVEGNQIVDQAGNPVWLTGTNWFGFNTTERVFHGLWSANITQTTKAMADRGINVVRVPVSTQLLLEWRDGQAIVPAVNTHANPELAGLNNLQVFDYWLELCEQYGLKVIIDVHSAEADNAGHMHNMWFKGSITTQDALDAWEWVAHRYRANDTIIGADLKNEPHGTANESPRAKWDDSTDSDNFKHYAEQAAQRILEQNPNMLILVEGIQIYPKSGVSWSSTNPQDYDNYWWGGNLKGVADHPVNLGEHQGQLLYSPHDYGPAVSPQPWFEGTWDRASLEAQVWDPYWLYIHKQGIAPLLIGEWGGFMDGGANQKWMTAIRDLIVDHRLHHTFWVLNPNSGDTGGLLTDDWATWDETKYALLKPSLWQEGGKFVSLDHEVALGGANSTTGISLNDAIELAGGTPQPTPDPDPDPTDDPDPDPTDTPDPGGVVCSATYRTTGDWGSGFQGEIVVTAHEPITSWTLTLDLGEATTNNLWSGRLLGNGPYTVANESWNGHLSAGGSATVGFIGNGSPPTSVSVGCAR